MRPKRFNLSMSEDHKARVKAALEKYYEKENKKASGPTRKNGSPEDDFCEDELAPAFKEMGWHMSRTESKSTYSEKQGRYISQSVKPGRPDYEGNTEMGIAAYVEAKAPGKLKTIRPAQYAFLLLKISQNCFGACIDNVETLKRIYSTWCQLPRDKRAAFLISELPTPRVKREEDLNFDD